MKLLVRLIALTVAFEATPAVATTITLTGGFVTWEAKSTLGLVRIFGKGAKPRGFVELDEVTKLATGTIECVLAPVVTGNKERDGHLHEKYLATKKWPRASLVLDPTLVASSGDFPWTGQLTIKGETKPAAGTASFIDGKLAAHFTVDLANYPAIGSPAWLGVHVANLVAVEVEASTKSNKTESKDKYQGK